MLRRIGVKHFFSDEKGETAKHVAAELMPLINLDRLGVIQIITGVLTAERESCYQTELKANPSATMCGC